MKVFAFEFEKISSIDIYFLQFVDQRVHSGGEFIRVRETLRRVIIRQNFAHSDVKFRLLSDLLRQIVHRYPSFAYEIHVAYSAE